MRHKGFTPGPWTVGVSETNVNSEKVGAAIAICIEYNGVDPNRSISRTAQKANAKLIADAPNLYAEVQRLQADNEKQQKVMAHINSQHQEDMERLHKAEAANKELREALESIIKRDNNDEQVKQMPEHTQPQQWNKRDPLCNGKYRVLVLMCDNPIEYKEDIDEYKNGYWLGYAQFVEGWQYQTYRTGWKDSPFNF